MAVLVPRTMLCSPCWHPSEWKGLKGDGWSYDGDNPGKQDWNTARNALKQMQVGDWIVATLPNNRAGRIGQLVQKLVHDEDWNPIVKPSRTHPFGENGRRINVRWDLASGPDDPAKVVLLPEAVRLNSGEIRATVRRLPFEKLHAIRTAMRDEANWVALAANFRHETALSDYLSIHPHRLEKPGMIAHPSVQVREFTFLDGTRADVVLLDRNERTVVVECKQNAPSLENIQQLSSYLEHIRKSNPELGEPRGILIHGGSRRVQTAVKDSAVIAGLELVHHELQVNFVGSA